MNVHLDPDYQLPAHAWPGGYPMHYVTRDGLTICPKCANDPHDPETAVVDGDVYWEGPAIQCDDCGALIESAYGDPDEAEGTDHDPDTAPQCGATHESSVGSLVCDQTPGHDGSHGNGWSGSTADTGYGPLSWQGDDRH